MSRSRLSESLISSCSHFVTANFILWGTLGLLTAGYLSASTDKVGVTEIIFIIGIASIGGVLWAVFMWHFLVQPLKMRIENRRKSGDA